MSQTHKSVRIEVYFNRDLNDNEIMQFVDNLLHKHPFVSDYEYEHPSNEGQLTP